MKVDNQKPKLSLKERLSSIAERISSPTGSIKFSNRSSLFATVLVWVLVLLISRGCDLSGSGNKDADNILSLNLEISRGDEGLEDASRSRKAELGPEAKNAKPAEQAPEETITEPAPIPELPAPEPEQVVPEKTVESIPVPEPSPIKEEPKKESPKPEPKPVPKPEPPKEPEKPLKLAKSVDDFLDDFWDSSFDGNDQEDIIEDFDFLDDSDNTKATGSLNADADTNSNAQASASGNGGKSLAFAIPLEGRKLEFPAEPVIHLSQRNSALLTQNVEVHLVFTITAQGKITEIKFSPANVIPRNIREEIQTILSTWKYEAAPSQTATFELHVVR